MNEENYKYIALLYKNNESLNISLQRNSTEEIVAVLESHEYDWNKAILRDNNEPFTELGHWIKTDKRILWFDLND